MPGTPIFNKVLSNTFNIVNKRFLKNHISFYSILLIQASNLKSFYCLLVSAIPNHIVHFSFSPRIPRNL